MTSMNQHDEKIDMHNQDLDIKDHDQQPPEVVHDQLDDSKMHILEKIHENPIVADQLQEEVKENPEENDEFRNPEPFEQEGVIADYPMDWLYNKKRVPYIEKNNGTIMLKEQSDYAKAIEHYNKALFAIKLMADDTSFNMTKNFEEYLIKVIQEVEIPVSSNLTLCYLKVKDYQSLLTYANKLLESNPDNVKMLYRRGLAYTNLMEFDKAKVDLKKAYQLEPTNKEIIEAFKIFKQKQYEYKYKTQKICENIFSKKNPELYEDKQKQEVKEEDKEEIPERRSIPYYIKKTVEVGFAIPLAIYKRMLEGPTSKIVNMGDSVIGIVDYIPIWGGLWKRTRKGTARILRNQFSKYLDKETDRETKNVKENEEVKQKDEGLEKLKTE